MHVCTCFSKKGFGLWPAGAKSKKIKNTGKICCNGNVCIIVPTELWPANAIMHCNSKLIHIDYCNFQFALC